MPNREFVHLHLHTDYSMLDSAIQIPALAKRLVELEMKACAITDHANLFGIMSFEYNMKKNGIHPVLGYEAYLTTESRHNRQNALKTGELPYYRLVLLAADIEGYFNLVSLASKAYTEGFYHKPRIDFELLSSHSKGLIGLSAGLDGLPGHFLKQNRFDQAAEQTLNLRDILGAENFFLEIQDHSLESEKQIRRGLIELSQKTEIPLVATNDAHYLTQDDARAHEMLLCIGGGKTINDESRPRFGADNYHLRSAAEMWEIFGNEMPETLTRTLEIAERCQVSLPSGEDQLNLPNYPIPADSGCEKIDEYFEQIVLQGFENRRERVWSVAQKSETLKYSLDVYQTRIESEIKIIRDMGFPGYFLIVWDFVRFARENNIPVGPGRGSAAGSLVAYCLEITDVDPIQYDLLFERFLNPERVSMPDIDIDFCVNGREAVIQHVVRRYGRESVCQIITFGTMASRAVVKDVGRALNIPYSEVEKVAKLIPPPVRGRNVSLKQALEQVEELRAAIENNPATRELMDLAARLEGCVRHTSVHAAGVVISPQKLDTLIPIATSTKEELTTQFAMSDLEKTGMLKMDFLALTTLTIINECLLSIKQKEKIEIDWANISLNDSPSMEIFGEGRTEAIFQFESPGMQEICRRLKPKDIEDLAALNALYRPGPLDGGMVDDFIARHRGRKPIKYLVPQMKDILHNTYGIIVYQEQIMQLAQKLAGYTLGEADMMRRAMGKKKREEMARHQEKFVQGAVERNIKPQKAEQIFSLMAQFADYGFNRSHSVAYAYLAFQTAYLKAHFPTHFYAAVLSHEAQDVVKLNKYISELRAAKNTMLPPDINESESGFTPINQGIRFGLSAVKGIGETAVQEILAIRGNQSFQSFFDFTARMSSGGASVNRRALHALICAGAFDSINESLIPLSHFRSALVDEIDSALTRAQKNHSYQTRGQNGLFGVEEENKIASINSKNSPKWTDKELLQNEKEALGFYLSSHPISKYDDLLKELEVVTIEKTFDTETNGEGICLCGIVSGLQIRISKKGNKFAMFKLEDLTGGLKCIVWSDSYNKYASLLREDEIVVVSGRLETAEDSAATFIAEDIFAVEEAKPSRATSALISLPPAAKENEAFCETLLALLNRHRGKCEVVLEIPLENKLKARLIPHGSLSIRGSRALESELNDKGCRVKWQAANFAKTMAAEVKPKEWKRTR